MIRSRPPVSDFRVCPNTILITIVKQDLVLVLHLSGRPKALLSPTMTEHMHVYGGRLTWPSTPDAPDFPLRARPIIDGDNQPCIRNGPLSPRFGLACIV